MGKKLRSESFFHGELPFMFMSARLLTKYLVSSFFRLGQLFQLIQFTLHSSTNWVDWRVYEHPDFWDNEAKKLASHHHCVGLIESYSESSHNLRL